tara:strand:- start:77 stop:835 length:759 start_codon:yes stop_codon:yes gene_type:complete
MKLIVISSIYIFFSDISAQSLKIKKPRNNSKIQLQNVVSIEWSSYRVSGDIHISYSNNGRFPWHEINIVGVKEKSYDWFVPYMSDTDGEILIRIYSVREPSVQSVIKVRLPNYSRTVATQTSKPKYKSRYQKDDETQAYYQKLFEGEGSTYDVFITKTDNIRYGPGTAHGIVFKSRYGERYKYVNMIGKWYVMRSYTTNKIYFTYETNGEVVSKGGYPKAITAKTTASSTSDEGVVLLWCTILIVLGLFVIG